MDVQIWFVLPLLTIVAFLYAAVGHGGASGYLALMSLFAFSPQEMRPTALVLNLFVSIIAFSKFAGKGYFRKDLFSPFALASVPASFLGGMIELNTELYKLVLGAALLMATLRMLMTPIAKEPKPIRVVIALLAGAGIGFLSGLIGIGGGILLSPLILLLGWGSVKETAATSALFIFVNSAAGLLGQWSGGLVFSEFMWAMVFFALAGGLMGAGWGAGRSSPAMLKRTLAFVLLLASLKLMVGV